MQAAELSVLETATETSKSRKSSQAVLSLPSCAVRDDGMRCRPCSGSPLTGRGAAERGSLAGSPFCGGLVRRRFALGKQTPGQKSGSPAHRRAETSSCSNGTWTSRWRTYRSAMLAKKDEEFETSVRLAAYYVEDASDGRLDNGLASNFKSCNVRNFACCLVQTHIAWHAVVISSCVLHSLLVVFSPGSPRDGINWTRLVEVGLLCVYVADILLKVTYMGAGTFLSVRGSKVWQTTYAVLTALLLLETLLTTRTRLTNPLRPVILVLRSRSVRNFYTTVLKICPSLLKVLTLLLFVLVATALAMARVMRGTNTTYFRSSAAALLELGILLLTQDNYQALLEDVIGHGSMPSLLLLFAFIVVGICFLMQLVPGTVIDTYMEEAQKEHRSKRVKQAKGLMRAFAVLDLRREGRLRQKAFDRLLQKLRPSDSPFERQLKFSLLSNKYKTPTTRPSSCTSTPCHSTPCHGRPGEVSPSSVSSPIRLPRQQLPKLPESPEKEFQQRTYGHSSLEPTIDPIDFLSLHTVLELTFKPRKPHWDVPGVAGEQPWWSRVAESAIANPSYELLKRASMLLDAAVFLADAEATQPIRSWGSNLQLNDALHAIFLLQVLAQVLALGSLSRAWRFGGGLHREILLATGISIIWAAGAGSARIRAMAAALGCLRSLRLAASCATLSRFCQCLADILPAMTQMLGLICVMHYAFASVAVELLGQQGAPGFATFLQAAGSLVQVLLGSDGTAVAAQALEKVHPATGLFFVAYYVVAVLVVLNLVTALMIEFYRASLAENVQHKEHRQAEIISQVQDVLREMEVVENLGFEVSAGYKESGIEKLRASFLGNGQADLVDEELLRKVQKEAPTDLVQLHREKSGSLGNRTPVNAHDA
eukprot:TRINITY_DN31437_c0_g1_i1.p1 TRINITY_DN31437_c0_g1~~TRINITY_DN31437_c0_g1_i1.p1  ORF type:complete len:878 (-),score=166.64 TRINITY_DN31437_c0_g1_i1:67-2700(-)